MTIPFFLSILNLLNKNLFNKKEIDSISTMVTYFRNEEKSMGCSISVGVGAGGGSRVRFSSPCSPWSESGVCGGGTSSCSTGFSSPASVSSLSSDLRV